MYMENEYVIEMLNITKEFPGIKANDNITLQLRKGEIHALLGENGAGKSTLMSILFGLYQPTSGTIKKNGQVVQINTPNDANDLNIGMVHQHFKLVECFSVLDNIILGVEPSKGLFLEKDGARKKVLELSERYGLKVEPDALISDITVGMQQRVEILKMLYRDNEVLIFDEPTAVLTPQEIEELMKIMKNLAHEGKSILFITHKLNEIMEVADRCTILRKGKYIGTVDIADTTKEELSKMMVGRNVSFTVDKDEKKPGDTVLEVSHLTVASRSHENNAVRDVSFQVRRGEIVCIAGIDGNGQTELVQGEQGRKGDIPVAGMLSSVKKADIQLAGPQFLQRAAVALGDHFHLGVGVLPLVLCQDAGKGAVIKELPQPHHQMGPVCSLDILGLFQGLAAKTGHLHHVQVKGLAGGGELGAPGGAVEQVEPRLLFQGVDLVGDGRLGGEQPLGRCAEIQLLCYGNKALQLVNGHRNSSPPCKTCTSFIIADFFSVVKWPWIYKRF